MTAVRARVEKSADAYRSIGEAAAELGLEPHVLRYWETRFPRQVSPVKRPDGRRYFSMLAPHEYSQGMPHTFLASYRYEHGETWTRADEIEGKDRRREAIADFAQNRLLKG